MNPTVNRPSESQPPERETLEVRDREAPLPTPDSPSENPESNPSPNNDPVTPADNPVTLSVPVRNHPIPPPSEPRQYRAIGLIRGCYQPGEESLTRGNLVAVDGTAIDAVLLGRAIGVVKNHLDLTVPHLWVVYPRTRQEGDLHVQIVGVWEPEVLGSKNERSPNESSAKTETAASEGAEDEIATPASPEAKEEASLEAEAETPAKTPAETPPEPPPETQLKAPKKPIIAVIPEPTLSLKDGYFSIRGEAVFYAKEEEKLIIKVQQAPRKQADKSRYFKLTLKGIIPKERVLGHFWDIQVMLQGNTLAIEDANDIGVMPVKKRKPGDKKKSFSKVNRGRRPGKFSPRPKGSSEQPSSPREGKPTRPVPKPIKPARNPKKEVE